jgi:hypothetical protein
LARAWGVMQMVEVVAYQPAQLFHSLRVPLEMWWSVVTFPLYSTYRAHMHEWSLLGYTTRQKEVHLDFHRSKVSASLQ